MDSLSTFLQHKLTQIALSALTICVVFSTLIVGSRHYFQEQHEHLVAPWEKADSIRQADISHYIYQLKDTSKARTLWAQYGQIEHFKSHHLLATKTFYRNYYSIITTLTVFSILLATFVFLLLKKGWDGEQVYVLKSLFLTTSVLTTVLYGYLQVYDLEANITKNLQKYFTFEKMQIDIHSGCYGVIHFKQQKNANASAEKKAGAAAMVYPRETSLDSIILTVNDKLAVERGLMVDFSVEKIPELLRQADKFGN
jgi:hypothetical protein